MTYSSAEARQKLLDDVADAIEQLALALAGLGEAYDELDEHAADELEQQLFRPLQHSYGRARRTHSEFAARYGLPSRAFEQGSPGMHSHDPRVYISRAIDEVEQADHIIAELQDSLLPVEVGDTELRAGLAEVRELIAQVPARGRALLRVFGR